MHIVSQMNPSIYSRARRKRDELRDRIVATLSGEWDRGWSLRWRVEPAVAIEELLEDLEFGRE